MAVSESEAHKVAELAALGLRDDEVRRLARDLSRILDAFAALREAEAGAGAAALLAEERAGPERPDEPGPCLTNEEALREAPDRDGGLFRVPKVI